MCGCLKVGLLRCSLQAIFLYSSVVVMGVGSLARLHEREPWIHRWHASFLVGVDGHPQGDGTHPEGGLLEGRVTEVGEAWRTESADPHAAWLCLSSPLPGTIRFPSRRSMWLLAGSLSLTGVLES